MRMFDAITAALVGAPVALAAYFRSKRGRAITLAWAKRLFNVDVTSDDLRSAVENMSTVVDAQGQSINWLTEQQAFLIEQLDIAKTELAEARSQLKELDELHRENRSLRKKVQVLEDQVTALETELARRKKYTPKAKSN